MFRDEATTVYPRSKSTFAIPKPIPLDAPVTIAVFASFVDPITLSPLSWQLFSFSSCLYRIRLACTCLIDKYAPFGNNWTMENTRKKKANLFDPHCSSRDVLELVGSKWSLLLLCALYDSKSRTGRLKRTIGGISQKMLTQTLREMQRNGIVNRISYPEVPPRVEYELTDLGYSLAELVVKMEHWIVIHHPIILKARKSSPPL